MQQLGWMMIDNQIIGVLARAKRRGRSFKIRKLGIIETGEMGIRFNDEEQYLNSYEGTDEKERLLSGDVVTL